MFDCNVMSVVATTLNKMYEGDDVEMRDVVMCWQDNVSTLLSVFEQCLSDAPDTAIYDALRHSVVILMGTLAKHLDADNPKVRPIVGLLIETLSTPSQQVTLPRLHFRRI